MDLNERVAELEAQIAELKSVVNANLVADQQQVATAPETAPAGRHTPPAAGGGTTPAGADSTPSRRGFMRAAAIGTAGAVAGAVAFSQPAAATDGSPSLLGVDATNALNVSTTPTAVKFNGTPLDNKNAFTFADSDVYAVSSNPATLAGYASGKAKHGAYGFTSSSDGYGVVAINGNPGGGSGLWARAVTGVAARLEGGKANALLVPGGTTGPVSGGHERGELYNDQNGDLWLCTTGGTPGTWRKLAGNASAGAFHVLAAPARLYDSRKDPAGKIPANTDRTISLASTSALAAVPAGATAAMFNLTITNTVGAGFLTVYSAALTTLPSTSNINWFGKDQILANLSLSAVDATARVKVYSGVNVTDVVIDVLGYYV